MAEASDRLRVAIIQLEYVPAARTHHVGWRLAEPILPSDPFQHYTESHLLSSISTRNDRLRVPLEQLSKQAEKTYVDNLELKLRELLTFCLDHSVKLAVLPEYAVPVSALRALLSFDTEIHIVAGVGALRRHEITLLAELGFDVSDVSQGMNCAVFVGPSTKRIISKKFAAADEIIHAGNGITSVTASMAPAAFTVGIGICLDAIKMASNFSNPIPDIVTIPALSRQSDDFINTPRDYLRLYANHSAYGGSYIGAPSIMAPGFADENGTIPLPPHSEAILIVDWDFRQRAITKPSSTNTPAHTVYARASVVYRGRDVQTADTVQRLLESTTKGQPVSGDAAQLAHELLSVPIAQLHSYPLLQENARQLETRYDVLLPEEIQMLARHCVLSERVLALPEWSYSQCVAVSEALKRWQDILPAAVSSSYGEYEDRAKHLAPLVRPAMTLPRHMAGSSSIDSSLPHGRVLVFYGTLGGYTSDDAAATFPRQLTLLRTLASLGDPTIALTYRLRGVRSPSGVMRAVYEIICTAGPRTEHELAGLREGFGQLLGVTFGGAYSLSYSHRDVEPTELDELLRSTSHAYEIQRDVTVEGDVREFDGFTDWSVVVDLVRAIDTELAVEMTCIGLPSVVDTSPAIAERDSGLIDAIFQGQRELHKLPLYLGSANALRDMDVDRRDSRRLALQIIVKGTAEIPRPVVTAIAAEIGGTSFWSIAESPTSLIERSLDDVLQDKRLLYRPAQALRVFHPGFGVMYASPGSARELSLTADPSTLPTTGISLGKARCRLVRTDETRPVHLSEADRLKHVYIIGKTGTGKTNLLKSMAAQDVQVPGRGVTIIDPHGDLVDYVLRSVPDNRIGEVVLIDLARPDALPVINPLDLDRDDIILRDRTIQDLIRLTRSRVFHQWTGPRFEEYMRLGLRTLVDSGYPEASSIVELPRLLTNKTYRKVVARMLRDAELRERWEFEDKAEDTRDWAETVHWVTSKFDELVRDNTLRAVLGGARSTIDIEEIVNGDLILLVRIPQAVIGKESADFIGSLILMEIQSAIIRRRDIQNRKSNALHFVYVDEFQNFANTDFHTIVAEARKFGIGFTIAHQNLEQLREFRTHTGETEQRLINAILGNVANMICFRVGSLDARILERQLHVDADDIGRIGRYSALCRLTVDNNELSPFTLTTEEAKRVENPSVVSSIVARMYSAYWVPRQETLSAIDDRISRVLKTTSD